MKLAINEIKKNKEDKEKENDATDWKSLLTGIYMINLKQKDRTIKIHKFDKKTRIMIKSGGIGSA